MSINTDFDSRINIKDLAVDVAVKKQNIHFDPERDITGEQWDVVRALSKKDLSQMIDLPIQQANSYGNTNIHEYLRGVGLIAPEIVRSNMDDHTWGVLVSQMENWNGEDSQITSISFLEKATFMKIAAPQKFDPAQIITDENWAHIQAEFFRDLGKPNEWTSMDNALRIAAEVRLLAPGKSREFDIGKSGWDYLEKKILNYIETIDAEPRSILLLPRIIKDAKVIDSNKLGRIPIAQSAWEKVWDFEKSCLEGAMEVDKDNLVVGTENYSSSGLYFASTAIMAAEEIQVTDAEIKLRFSDPNKFESHNNPDMPEVRKF